MSRFETKLKELGIVLPERNWQGGKLLACRQEGDLLYCGGFGPTDPDGVMRLVGKLGQDLTVEQGYQAARNCAVVTMAYVKSYLGDMDRIAGVVKVNGYINSTADFTEPGKVLDGYSDLWLAVLGEAGRHARVAIPVPTLASNISVEVDCILKLHPDGPR